MRQALKITACVVVIVIAIFASCKKEVSCYDCKENKPPIANAGADQTITLPKDSAMLDGSASTDPEYNTVDYINRKIRFTK
ncbi:MAG: hypothetical protein WKI04_19220 [Ferruginibacter sp.]